MRDGTVEPAATTQPTRHTDRVGRAVGLAENLRNRKYIWRGQRSVLSKAPMGKTTFDYDRARRTVAALATVVDVRRRCVMGLFDYADAGRAPPAERQAASDLVFLEGLSSAAWKKILAHAQIVHFREGQEIIRAGDRDDSFYVLSQGSVDVVLRAKGKDLTLTTIPEGSVFGEVAFFDRAPRSATIRAQTAGTAVCLTRDAFDRLSSWEPVLARAILIDLGRVLALRLRSTTQRSQN